MLDNFGVPCLSLLFQKSCICGLINKKPLAKLREPAGKEFRVVKEPTIVTFDPDSSELYIHVLVITH